MILHQLSIIKSKYNIGLLSSYNLLKPEIFEWFEPY